MIVIEQALSNVLRLSRERFRTAVNVLGDAFGAAIVADLSKADLAKIPLASIETDSNSNLPIASSAEIGRASCRERV